MIFCHGWSLEQLDRIFDWLEMMLRKIAAQFAAMGKDENFLSLIKR